MLGGARNGSLWLCYAGSLVGKQKNGISVFGEDRCQLPGEKHLAKLGEEEEEKEEPAIEQRREHANLRSDLGEMEDQVACLASAALVLAITDEAR